MAEGSDFRQRLEKSGLLSADALTEAADWLGRGDAPEAIAQRLVEAGALTPWQAEMLLAGRSSFFLGKYKLLSLLGKGGMGAVFKAEQVALGRIVAIKVMDRELMARPESVARFRREIQAAATLQHPHVVTAFDADQVNETHFLVMEFLEGESLEEVLRREKRLPVPVACEYIRQAALGLQHAFERGMSHRDIKPGNLLLTRTEEGAPLVKVLDMGLARFTSEATEEGELTKTGQVMGTPDYIAPEQAQRTHDADIRSDIFSLGCTLYRLVTGQLPYRGANVMEKLMARALHEAPRVRQVVPELPVELDVLVARMLERDPARRYQSPAEVAQALQGLAQGPARVAAPAAARSALSESGSPDQVADRELNQFLVDLADVAGGVPAVAEEGAETTAGTHAGAATLLQARPERNAGSRGPRKSRRLLPVVAGAVALMLLIAALFWNRTGAATLVIDWPEADRSQASLEIDGRPQPVPATGAIELHPGAGGTHRLRLSRAGYREVVLSIALVRGESRTIRPLWQPTGGRTRGGELAEFLAAVREWKPSADGANDDPGVAPLREQYRALRPRFLGKPQLADLDRAGRALPSLLDRLDARNIPERERRIAEKLTGTGTLPAEVVAIWGDGRLKTPGAFGTYRLEVHPSGNLAATIGSERVGTVWELQSGEPLLTFPYSTAVAFSPDGSRVATAHETLDVWSLEKRELVTRVPIERAILNVTEIVFIPHSDLVALGGNTNQVLLYNLADGGLVRTLALPDKDACVASLAASRDGDWLAAGGCGGHLQLWSLANGASRELPHEDTPVTALAFCPDSRMLASGTHVPAHVWSVDTGERISTIRRENYGVHSMSWDSAGKVLAVNSTEGAFRLWDAQTGALLRTVEMRGSGMSMVGFAEDDRLVGASAHGGLNRWSGPDFRPEWQIPSAALCAAVDPFGEWLAVGTSDRTIELWRLDTGERTRSFECPSLPSHVDVTPDGAQLLVCFGGMLVPPQVIDLARGTARTLPHEADVRQGVFTPDGRLVVTAHHRGLSVWNAATLAEVFTTNLPPGDQKPSTTVEVAADGRRAVLLGTDGRNPIYRSISLSDGDVTAGDVHPGPMCLAPFSDGRHMLIAAGHSGMYRVDAATMAVKGTGYGGDAGASVWTSLQALPGTGDTFVGSALDGKLRWLTWNGLEVVLDRTLDLGGSATAARQIIVAPDGRHLILVMTSGTVWIVRSGTPDR